MATLAARIAVGAAGLTALVAAALIVWRPQEEAIEKPTELFLVTGQIRLGVDLAQPPFAFDREGRLSGFDVDLAAALSEQIQMPVVVSAVSFDGMYDALLTGRVDALASVRVDQPMKGIVYTRPYADAGWLLCSLLSQPVHDWRDLSGRRLSVEFASEGDSIARAWLRRIHPFEILRYETSLDALDALLFGQSDAALIPALTQLPEDVDPQDLQTVLVISVPLGLAARAGDQEMMALVQFGLDALEAEGTLEALQRRWLGGLR